MSVFVYEFLSLEAVKFVGESRTLGCVYAFNHRPKL